MKLLFLILLGLAPACFAQPSPADYLSAPFPTDLKGSEEGRTVGWVFNDQGVRNIYTATAPIFKANRITFFTGDEGLEITDVTLSPDGSALLFVRGNDPNSSGEAANPAQLQRTTEKILWR
jgi:hypothetical protein